MASIDQLFFADTDTLFESSYDAFNSASHSRHLDEHNYSKFEYSTSASDTSLSSFGTSDSENLTVAHVVDSGHLETPFNELQFLSDDLFVPVPFGKDVPVVEEPRIEQNFEALPDLAALVDKETLAEALCLVEMGNSDETAVASNEPESEPEAATNQEDLVATLCDFFTTTAANFKAPPKPKSLLPMYAAKSGEESPESSSSFSRRSPVTKTPPNDFDVVTDDERQLMAREGIFIPVPSDPNEAVILTEEQERILKNVRRKVRNKESAKESRKRKASYIETLEKRVKVESTQNDQLKGRVRDLEQENEFLNSRLQYMQGFVEKMLGTVKQASRQPTQKSTCVFVLIFALCLVIAPRNGLFSLPNDVALASSAPQGFNSVDVEPVDALMASPDNPMPERAHSFVFSYEPSSVAERAVDL